MTHPSAPVAAAARTTWAIAIMQCHHESHATRNAAGEQAGSVSSHIEATNRTTKLATP
ncbi:hypothetical protein [Cupriavidus sp. WS]|nr:hypothetical protein [Cupriavidus sp. WS]